MISHLVRKSELTVISDLLYAEIGINCDQVVGSLYAGSLLDTDTIPSAIKIHGTPKHKWMLCRD